MPDIQGLVSVCVRRPGWMAQLGTALWGHKMQKSLKKWSSLCDCNIDFLPPLLAPVFTSSPTVNVTAFLL